MKFVARSKPKLLRLDIYGTFIVSKIQIFSNVEYKSIPVTVK